MMINLQGVENLFTAQAQGMHVSVDPISDQQTLNIQIAVQVSLPHLLKQLVSVASAGSAAHARPKQTWPHGKDAPPPPPPLPDCPLDKVLSRQSVACAQSTTFDRTAVACSPLAATTTSIRFNMPRAVTAAQNGNPEVESVASGVPYVAHGTPEGSAVISGAAQCGTPEGSPVISEGSAVISEGRADRGSQLSMVLERNSALSEGTVSVVTDGFPTAPQLMAALQANHMSEVRSMLARRADVNNAAGHPCQLPPLCYALENDANLEVVNLLIKAAADVNMPGKDGLTPLHLSINNGKTPPLVVRMLLVAQADVGIKNEAGATPVDYIRRRSALAFTGEDSVSVRQILNEVAGRPTVDVIVMDTMEPVLAAFFSDIQNENVIFFTSGSIAVYNVAKKKQVLVRRIKQKQATSYVRSISVNPLLGTFATCLEVWQVSPDGKQNVQNVFIIWPKGKFQEEEPLKLCIQIDSQSRGASLPPKVVLSRGTGTQSLVGRLGDGKVYCWQLDTARLQVANETELVGHDNAGEFVISDDGNWIAVVVFEKRVVIKVFTYIGFSGRPQEPLLVYRDVRSPRAMAIQQRVCATSNTAVCHLALADVEAEDAPSPPIEIYSIALNGTSSLLYRLKVPSPCCNISFCHGGVSHLVSNHDDGLFVLYDLEDGKTNQCQGHPEANCNVSVDRKLLLMLEHSCIRICKVL